jgi:hypothetical protein
LIDVKKTNLKVERPRFPRPPWGHRGDTVGTKLLKMAQFCFLRLKTKSCLSDR